MQTLKPGLISRVCRCDFAAVWVKVGVYYSPLNWRDPGYYHVTDARGCGVTNGTTALMRNAQGKCVYDEEEVYEQVQTLFKEYGPFDYVFWDGGWPAQRGSDR